MKMAKQEIRFDPLEYLDLPANAGWTLAQATAQARKDRDICLRVARQKGTKECKGWSIRGQLRKYRAWGVPCGHTRTVYYITIYE
jgi:hypothetical protein